MANNLGTLGETGFEVKFEICQHSHSLSITYDEIFERATSIVCNYNDAHSVFAPPTGRFHGYADGPAEDAKFLTPSKECHLVCVSTLVIQIASAAGTSEWIAHCNVVGSHVKRGNLSNVEWLFLNGLPSPAEIQVATLTLAQLVGSAVGYICIDKDGSILVSDTFNHCIRKISADRTHVSTVAGSPSVAGVMRMAWTELL